MKYDDIFCLYKNCYSSLVYLRKKSSMFFPLTSALTHVDNSECILQQFWCLHEARLNRCLALRHFEQRFKEVQCTYIQLHNNLSQLPDINTSLLRFEYYRTDNNTNIREEIDQTLIQLDDLSQRTQVIISFHVILSSRYTCILYISL